MLSLFKVLLQPFSARWLQHGEWDALLLSESPLFFSLILFSTQNCFTEAYGVSCSGCGQTIGANELWVEALDRNWHPQCFVCGVRETTPTLSCNLFLHSFCLLLSFVLSLSPSPSPPLSLSPSPSPPPSPPLSPRVASEHLKAPSSLLNWDSLTVASADGIKSVWKYNYYFILPETCLDFIL